MGRYKVVDTNTVAIQDDSLRMTEMGLMYGLRYIPSQDRKRFASYRWAGETHDETGKRWLLISVAQR